MRNSKKSQKKNKSKKSQKINRREFIKRSGQAGLALAALSSGCVSAPKPSRSTASASSNTVSPNDPTPDFIIVGSGAGGGPLAMRLAQKGHSVWLLEAGGDPNPVTSQVPGYHPLATEDDSISWRYFVDHYSDKSRQSSSWDSKYKDNLTDVFAPYAAPKDGKGIFYPRTAALGGCTTHNAMIVLRPDNEDWDGMSALFKDPTWAAANMHQYWERMERNQYLKSGLMNRITKAFEGKESLKYDWKNNPGKMGKHGWLPTELSLLQASFGELKETALEAMILSMGEVSRFKHNVEELIHGAINYDPNQLKNVQARPDGMYLIPKSTNQGVRSGVRDFLQNAPPLLKIMTNCFVTQLMFDEKDPTRVTGVYYLPKNHVYWADKMSNQAEPDIAPIALKANREVILAGGAFNSPQLLMLSGIGDPEHLRSVDIEPRVTLPGVGLNLQDRYEVGVISELKHNMKFLEQCDAIAGDMKAGYNPADPCLKGYQVSAVSKIRSVYGSNGVVISMIKRSNAGKATPDLVIFGVPGSFKGYYPGYSRDAFTKNNFTWAVLKGHTQNTGGTVRLRSNKPWDTPQICFNYFDNGTGDWNDDLNSVVEGLQTIRSINSTPLAKGVLTREVVPGEKEQDLRSFVMREAWGHHASCSNKMGTDPNAGAVVAPDFKVHGTKGLRVVDASVFPKIPGLFIVSAIYMISEKAADVIDKEYPKG